MLDIRIKIIANLFSITLSSHYTDFDFVYTLFIQYMRRVRQLSLLQVLVCTADLTVQGRDSHQMIM
jgi:hypothetical protein